MTLRAWALYECLHCGTSRRYGNVAPEDKSVTPRINCESCGRVTVHGFLRVSTSPLDMGGE